MKPTRIQRDIQSRHARSEGAGPKLGRVSRLRDSEVTMEVRKSRRSGRREPNSPVAAPGRGKVVLIWSLALTVTTLLLVGGVMMFWVFFRQDPLVGVNAGKNLLESEENVRVISKFTSPGEDEALELVKRALATRDPDKVAANFRLGGAKPAEVVEFMSRSETRDGKIERFDWLSSMDVEGLVMEGVLVVYGGKAEPGERLAFLVPDEAGVWKVDFDAFARSSRPSWKDLLDGREDHAQVRVFIAKDSYYNGPFSDESHWACFAVASPETKELMSEEHDLLRGYCRVGSPQAKALQRIFADGARANRATLDIRRIEGADDRQFEIAQVLSEDWVIPPVPFDEKFK